MYDISFEMLRFVSDFRKNVYDILYAHIPDEEECFNACANLDSMFIDLVENYIDQGNECKSDLYKTQIACLRNLMHFRSLNTSNLVADATGINTDITSVVGIQDNGLFTIVLDILGSNTLQKAMEINGDIINMIKIAEDVKEKKEKDEA